MFRPSADGLERESVFKKNGLETRKVKNKDVCCFVPYNFSLAWKRERGDLENVWREEKEP